MDTFVFRNFETIAMVNETIVEIDIDDLFAIINDDMLNVKDEEFVWECCLRWIDFDPEKRKQYLEKLLTGTRMGLLKFQVIFLKNICVL